MLMNPAHRSRLRAIAMNTLSAARQAPLCGLVLAALQHGYCEAVEQIDALIESHCVAKNDWRDLVALKHVRSEAFYLVPFKVEIANKHVNGRVVGDLYGVTRWVDGRRAGWGLAPQESEERARNFAAKANKDPGDFVE